MIVVILSLVIAVVVLIGVLALMRMRASGLRSFKADESNESIDPLLGEIDAALRDPVLIEQARRRIRHTRRSGE